MLFESTIFHFNDAQLLDPIIESEHGLGTYYRFGNRSLRLRGVTDGMAFSPCGKTMYRDEASVLMIHASGHDYEVATPSNQRLFGRLRYSGWRDRRHATSLLVDATGRATMRLNRTFAPDGKLDFAIEI